MPALFFGDSESPLFGVWSQPSGDVDLDHGVILCPPIAQEHVRTHWAFRQVAAALCRAGFHCFRFDWFGVGDSAGELREATIARWKSDLADAAQELRDASNVRAVSLVGLRFGATIAALSAEDIRPSIRSIVLWDPVVHGRDYIAGLEQLTHELLTDSDRYWNPPDTFSRRSPREELVGFDFGRALLSEIEGVELAATSVRSVRAPLCLLRSSAADAHLGQLGEQLRGRDDDVEIRDTELQAKWTSAKDIEELLLPGDAIRTLVGFLESHAS